LDERTAAFLHAAVDSSGGMMRKFELALETVLFQSRWLLAPFYLGLAAALVLLLVHFVIEFGHFAGLVLHADRNAIVLGILGLIDIAFMGNLVLIVIFSGYENFVSRIEMSGHDRPEWMAKVDFGGLKQKLMTSIVAISAVEVLKAFMNIEQYDPVRLGWLVGIHGVFLASLLAVVIADRLGDDTKPPEEKSEARGGNAQA
jgi:uncharacterized protein (TIGR00645 family)